MHGRGFVLGSVGAICTVAGDARILPDLLTRNRGRAGRRSGAKR